MPHDTLRFDHVVVFSKLVDPQEAVNCTMACVINDINFCLNDYAILIDCVILFKHILSLGHCVIMLSSISPMLCF